MCVCTKALGARLLAGLVNSLTGGDSGHVHLSDVHDHVCVHDLASQQQPGQPTATAAAGAATALSAHRVRSLRFVVCLHDLLPGQHMLPMTHSALQDLRFAWLSCGLLRPWSSFLCVRRGPLSCALVRAVPALLPRCVAPELVDVPR